MEKIEHIESYIKNEIINELPIVSRKLIIKDFTERVPESNETVKKTLMFNRYKAKRYTISPFYKPISRFN